MDQPEHIDEGSERMAIAGLIGCSPNFGCLPGIFDQKRLDLFDDNIISRSVFEEIVGSLEAICRLTAQVVGVAASDAIVLITGEGGTGKELPARAIRRRSNRSRLPFICCALLVMEMG
jgi:transcriptional regulator with GAF, ATPase, and Fis domain